MPQNTGAALDTALAYFRAWTGHDFDQAMTFVSPDIVCHAPAGRLEGAEAFRGFMEPFSRIVTRSQLLGAFGDDDTALLMYDTDTVPVPNAPGAECLTRCRRDGSPSFGSSSTALRSPFAKQAAVTT